MNLNSPKVEQRALKGVMIVIGILFLLYIFNEIFN